MGKIYKNKAYEQEADQLSYDISRKSTSEKALSQNLADFLGTDFSGVQIHQDDLMGETAYTQGNDIFLDTSVDTRSSFGRQVLGHELVHTAQQGAESSMVSPAPAGVMQFYPDRDENDNLVLPNEGVYKEDMKYQGMRTAYMVYTEDKQNPIKKIIALKAASDYMMHNTDISADAEGANMGRRQKHNGRMQIAEQIIYDLTVDPAAIAQAGTNIDTLSERAHIEDDAPYIQGIMQNQNFDENDVESMANENKDNALGLLRSSIEGNENISKTLQAVIAGTLGHLKLDEGLRDVVLGAGSGLTPHYNAPGEEEAYSITFDVFNRSTPQGQGSTMLHELTHLANSQIYQNYTNMSVVSDVEGETKGDRIGRHREKALRRYGYLTDLDRLKSLDSWKLLYAGLGTKFSNQYAGGTLAGIAVGDNPLLGRHGKAVQDRIGEISDKDSLQRVLESGPEIDGMYFGNLLTGRKWDNAEHYIDLILLDRSMRQNQEGTLTSLVEYDTKLTDLLFQMETEGTFDETDPAHRRLKAMVMEAYVEREIQRIQNEQEQRGQD